MKYLKNQYLFESKTYNPKNLILEICVSMVLLNNEFLDSLLDKGNKSRYENSTQAFVVDIKNILLAKNRLKLGKIQESKCVEDDNSKLNVYFNSLSFDIEKDWNDLINSRIIARNIIDKLVPDEKIDSDRISNIYILGPNRIGDRQEDIVIELTDGKQYSIYLNKNASSPKTSSFNTLCDSLIGSKSENLYQGYIKEWNTLVRDWIKITYQNSNLNIKNHIEKFLDISKIDNITYFQYFEISHRDPRFKNLGEKMNEFEKNILKLSDLMNEIWKNENNFIDFSKANLDWEESKKVNLNSRILESLLSSSLKTNSNEIKKLENGFKESSGVIKMKIMKLIIDKLGSLEYPIYQLSSNGNVFNVIPSKKFFRKNYDKMKVLFDYHVNFNNPQSDFIIKFRIIMNDNEIIPLDVVVNFSGGEFSSKLNAKFKFDLPMNFRYLVT